MQTPWLFDYLHDPSRETMRPWLNVRMPTFGFSDEEVNTLIGYFTSVDSREAFLSANPHFCKSALSRYTQWDFIELVERHGIEYFEKETVNGLSGQLFCRESSKQIVAALLNECQEAGAEVITQCDTAKISQNNGFHLEGNKGTFSA